MYSLITLITDYGFDSPYVAAIKGCVYAQIPNGLVVEITNQINPFDITQAAFLLNSVYKNFPAGTWHLIGVDTNIDLHKQVLIVEHEGHYFIGADNGIFSILFDPLPEKVYKVLSAYINNSELFADKNIFVGIAASFFKTGSLNNLTEPGVIETIRQSIQPTIEDTVVRGTVMYVDGFNNAITNITKELFEQAVKGRKFTLYYWGRHSIKHISKHYHEGKPGDDIMLFNENNYLEIAMNRGRGAQLLGLKVGSKIIIEISAE
ncbi:MAG: SAM-dependent chlorinase/fluorinase [Bacteroidia bacterium]|nr:SAM-dependent chlorinase/fluorinase [Bacteroidia bacterium]